MYVYMYILTYIIYVYIYIYYMCKLNIYYIIYNIRPDNQMPLFYGQQYLFKYLNSNKLETPLHQSFRS